jgi:pyridoxine kinase
VARVKAANPAAVYSCDPVMGNARGCFVAPAIPVLLRDRVVPAADIITPNQFELGFLTETEPTDLDLDARVGGCRARDGPAHRARHVGRASGCPEGTIEMLAVTDDGAWIVQTPRIPMKANGSGDVTAALFTAHYRASGDAADALAKTVSSVYDLLQTTFDSGQRELQLVEAQEFYAHPRLQFPVTRVR